MRNILFPSATTHRHAFTPPWYEELTSNKPVFYLRAGSIADRAQYEADLDAETGGQIFPAQKDLAFQAGVEELLKDQEGQPENTETRAKLFELLAQIRGGETVSAKDRTFFNQAWDAIASEWPDLKALIRREALRDRMLPGLALLHFCTGFENVKDANGEPLTFEADNQGRLKEEVLLKIDPSDLWLVGQAAHNLQWGRSVEKNFSLPSKSKKTGGRSRATTKAPGS